MIVSPWNHTTLEKVDQKYSINVVPVVIYAISRDQFTEKVWGFFLQKKYDGVVITLLIQVTVVFTFVSSMLITVEHESVAYYSTLKMILIIKQDKITLLLHAIGISNVASCLPALASFLELPLVIVS